MYASHRDACILKRYSLQLTELLDSHYSSNGLDGAVIAYRKLGKANYDFAADAFRFAVKMMPCSVLCFDITGFFDNLDHGILKDRLKLILGTGELSTDWYRVFRTVTHFRTIERSDLQKHPVFGPRFKHKFSRLIGSIKDIKDAGVAIVENPNRFGIPQGTPISSALSNLYLLDFDAELLAFSAVHGCLYQRYSDDILIVCPLGKEADIIGVVENSLREHRLELAADKTDQQKFDPTELGLFQYLGLTYHPMALASDPAH